MLRRAVETRLPTAYGEFQLRAYTHHGSPRPHPGRPIQSVDDSIRFVGRVHHPVGDGVTFVGIPVP